MQVGIYSGTFDPIHIGHLAFANEAAKRFQLDKVIFMPETTPRGKFGVTPIDQRIYQIKQAIDGSIHQVYTATQKQFDIVDTLPELTKAFPESTLNFLMGADVAMSLGKWPHIDMLLSHYRIIVGIREGYSPIEVGRVLTSLGANFEVVSTPHSHVSSRDIRSAMQSPSPWQNAADLI